MLVAQLHDAPAVSSFRRNLAFLTVLSTGLLALAGSLLTGGVVLVLAGPALVVLTLYAGHVVSQTLRRGPVELLLTATHVELRGGMVAMIPLHEITSAEVQLHPSLSLILNGHRSRLGIPSGEHPVEHVRELAETIDAAARKRASQVAEERALRRAHDEALRALIPRDPD